MPRLSIIFPVYNAEAYVRKALESVFATDVPPDVFEVIVVDDGSTDGSKVVVREFSDKPNFIFVEQENRGPGGARMRGVSAATGDYLWFLDSDDYLIENAIGKVLKLLNEKSDADVIMFPLIRIGLDSQIKRLDYQIEAEMLMTGKDIIKNPKFRVYSPPRFVIKSSLMENKWLYFPERLIHEDEYFGIVLLFLSERVWVMPDPVYVHPSRSGSIMNTLTIRSLNDIVTIHRLEMRFMREVLNSDEHAWFRSCCLQQLIVCFDRIPRRGICWKGFYIWHSWKKVYPGRSLKNQLGRWFYFVLPGLYDRFFQPMS